jgi:hypothetical protein
MSDFGDFEDPTSDFLARERAVLGGDADLFSTNDSFSSPIMDTPDLSVQSQYNASPLVSTPANDYSVFESSYPQADNLESSKVKTVKKCAF